MSKLSKKNDKENPVERNQASIQLDAVKEKIMVIWESRVRENIKSAPSKSVLVLRNMLPELLDNLVSNISSNISNTHFDNAGRIGKEHGEQRAALPDYTFSQVLLEYRILRQVIFEVLEEDKLQITDVRDIILNVLDEGIEKAIENFSQVRSEELKRSNRDLENFAAIVAHDLKAPLATIMGFAELLDNDLKGRIEIEETEYLQSIKRSSARMAQLIDRLLEYSSVGREIKQFEPVPTTQVVKDVIENLKLIIEKLSAKVLFKELPTVIGDATLLSQLFQNFLSNSLKFRSANRVPEISIEAKSEGAFWLFSVKDNGIGFDTKDTESIFSLFKRLDHAKSNGGLGIGLATARKVVEIHGGQVWAESQPGNGSTFFFTLPKNNKLIPHSH